MADEKINLTQFDDLPSAFVDTDEIHVNRSGKDYNAKGNEVLKKSDLVNDVTVSEAEKPSSSASVNKNYNKTVWNNNADGILFTFDSFWSIVRTGTNLVVTIPKGSFVLVDSILKNGFTTLSGSIDDGGGVVIRKNGGQGGVLSFVSDISSIVEGDSQDKYVIAKNIGGVMKSRIPSVMEKLYEGSTSVSDLSWLFDNTISEGDPSAGNFRLNNSDPASVTEIYFSKLSHQGIDVTNVLLDIQGGTEIQIIQQSDFSKNIIGTVGTVTDATNYVKVTITPTGYGSLFTLSAECSTSLYYEVKESNGDISRNYQTIEIDASIIDGDFDFKNEVWGLDGSGANLEVGENISLTFANNTNAKTANIAINVTGIVREITLPTGVISNDSRFDSATNKLTLSVGEYLLRFQFTGINIYLEVLPEMYGEAVDINLLEWDFDETIAQVDPTSGFFNMNNVDPALVTEIRFSNITNSGLNATNIVINSSGKDILQVQSDDSGRFIFYTVSAIILETGYTRLTVVVLDSGLIFEDSLSVTTSLFAKSGGGGHVIYDKDGNAYTQEDILQYMGKVVSETGKTQLVPRFDESEDVDMTGLADGDATTYNATTLKHEPSSTTPNVNILPTSEVVNANDILNTSLEHGYSFFRIVANNSTGVDCTISIGSTALGTDIVNAQEAIANSDTSLLIAKDFFDMANDTDLYVTSDDVTGTITLYFTPIIIN